MSAAGHDGRAELWLRLMPAVFVLIWSTGFIVARYGMPHAPPMSFLAWRYVLSIACLLAWALAARAVWPRGRWQWAHLAVVGVLMHAGYLGGVWAAIKAGMGAGMVALLVGLQPVLTALWTSSRGGAIAPRQWVGLSLGLGGLMLVVGEKLGLGEVRPQNMALALMALLSITAGTLYQKRFVTPCDVRTANMVQLMAALIVTLPLALLEPESIRWLQADGSINPHLAGAMAWSVLALTLGGSSLLYLLIQRGAATTVSSLMYMVPPATALLAWVLFDEPITALVLIGVALAATGVSLVVRVAAPRPH